MTIMICITVADHNLIEFVSHGCGTISSRAKALVWCTCRHKQQKKTLEIFTQCSFVNSWKIKSELSFAVGCWCNNRHKLDKVALLCLHGYICFCVLFFLVSSVTTYNTHNSCFDCQKQKYMTLNSINTFSSPIFKLSLTPTTSRCNITAMHCSGPSLMVHQQLKICLLLSKE